MKLDLGNQDQILGSGPVKKRESRPALWVDDRSRAHNRDDEERVLSIIGWDIRVSLAARYRGPRGGDARIIRLGTFVASNVRRGRARGWRANARLGARGSEGSRGE